MEVIATDETEREQGNRYIAQPVNRDTVAFLQYTSGSTGNPKGVVLTHGNLLHNAALVHHAVEHAPGDSYVSWLPIFHDMGFMAGVLQPLYGGLPCFQMSPAAFLEQPIRWLKAISKFRATTSGGPNFSYELCVRKVTQAERAQLDLSSWSVAFNGAEPVRAETMQRFAEVFAESGFRGTAFYPCYGLAEATLMVSGSVKGQISPLVKANRKALEDHEIRETSNGAPAQLLVSSGRNLLDQEIAIVHPDSLRRCAAAEVGEIWVKGASVAKGYWEAPQESEKTFSAYTQNGDGPFLRTGDLGFIQHGHLYVTGRLKDLLIIRGQNHYPQDIELTVERCASVLQPGSGAAFSVDANGEERLVIVQEAANRRDSDLDAVLKSIRQSVSEAHELMPLAIILIRTGTIPKTSSGKIQRRACKQAFLDRSLHVLAEWHETESIPNRSEDTGTLPGVVPWLTAEIANKTAIAPERIDIHQPLTTYGLDSLSAIELAHRLQADFGIQVTMSDLFGGMTIAGIEKLSSATESVAPANASDVFPLSYGQQALWFLQQMAPESTAYNISRAVRIHSLLDVEALENAFQMMLNQHPALRTTFSAAEGGPLQHVRSEVQVAFEQVDAGGWNPVQIEKALAEESYRPFDLLHGPVFRVCVFRLSPQDHVLHLAVHHLVADFWSLMVLMEEAGRFYAALVQGSALGSFSPRHSYADFVEWQRRKLQGAGR